MPDNDIFRRNVNRGWQKAARLNFGAEDDPNALPSAIRALGGELKGGGCPRFPEIITVVTGAIESANFTVDRRLAFDELEHINFEAASGITEIAVNVAKRLISQHQNNAGSWSENVAVQILAGIAVSRMCPAAIIHALVEEGSIPYQTLDTRRKRSQLRIATAPETLSLAKMLLADPTGVSVKAPQIRRVRMSQADILLTALTDS